MSTSINSPALFREIVRRCSSQEQVVLATLVGSLGSSPQELGAKMLVCLDGTALGTLGGGCVEAEVRRQAESIFAVGTGRLLQFQLDQDLGWDDGMICGGKVDIYLDLVTATDGVRRFGTLLEKLEQREPCQFRFSYQVEGRHVEYVETISASPQLVIAGAGHVSQSLARFAACLDFDVVVIDDRADYAHAERFPAGTRLLIGDVAAHLRDYPADESTYFVLATRGHKRDAQALEAVIQSPAKYIGMIGSKRKARTILAELANRGMALEHIERVHSPIGLELNAITVPEIAISILAEIISVRRGREGCAAEPMWLRRSTIDRLLDCS